LSVLTVREPDAPASIDRESPSAVERLPISFKSYLIILALFSLGNSSDAFLLLRARDLGLSVTSLPLLWAALHVSKLVSSYLGGDWSDRIARPKLIISGWLVYAATYLAFGAARERWHVWALFIVYGVYYGLTEPAEKALVKDLVPAHVRGRAYGYYNFVIGVTAVPAGVLTGLVWQTEGSMAALSLGAALACASSLGLVAWTRIPKAPAPLAR